MVFPDRVAQALAECRDAGSNEFGGAVSAEALWGANPPEPDAAPECAASLVASPPRPAYRHPTAAIATNSPTRLAFFARNPASSRRT